MLIETFLKTIHIKMKHPVRIIIIFALFQFTSCDNSPAHVKSFLYFADSEQTVTLPYNADSTYSISLNVDLIGPTFANNQNFYIRTDNKDIFGSFEDSLIFGKGIYSKTFELHINPHALNYESIYAVGLWLEGNNISENYNTKTLYIVKHNFLTTISGFYNCTDKLYNNSYSTTLSMYSEKDTSCILSNFWDFAENSSNVYFTFKPEKDSVYIFSEQWTDKKNREFRILGRGKIDSAFNMEIHYKMFLQPIDTLFEEGIQLYTKQ